MRTIEDLLGHEPFFTGLGPDDLALLAGCARNVHVSAGDHLFHTGQPADAFYLVRRGRVSIEVHDPRRGVVVLDTVDDGDVVGWSWLVPPYRWTFDARAAIGTSAVRFDGVCLREKCEADPRLGYLLMQRVAHVMYERLRSARVRLLDVYGRT